MSIVIADIKLLTSQDQSDTDNGGGPISADVVVDAVVGEIWGAITSLSRSTGSWQPRRTFLKCDTAANETYGGAHVCGLDKPTDSSVSVELISSTVGQRDKLLMAAACSLYAKGAQRTGSALDEAAAAGDTTIQTQYANSVYMSVGSVYLLCGSDSKGVTRQELVKIASVDTVDVSYTLGTPIIYDYVVGSAFFIASPSTTNSIFYGTTKLSSGASAGASSLSVVSVDSPTLPTSSWTDFTISGIATVARLARPGDTILIKEGTTEEYAVVAGVSTGAIAITGTLTNTYTTAAYVSSIIELGDLTAAKSVDFSQETWSPGEWADTQSGSAAGGSFNFSINPLALANDDAETDRYCLDFTSAIEFTCYSEQRGVIGTGSTAADFAPTSPLTGGVYFTLDKDGFSGTFQVGNCIRFNTTGAYAPFWICRTVQAGATGTGNDGIDLGLRGDEV